MNMIQASTEYVNLMAMAFKVLASVSELNIYLLYASSKCAEIYTNVKNKIDEAKAQDINSVLRTIRGLIDNMMDKSIEDRCSYAAAICLCMDNMICYVPEKEKESSILVNGTVYLHNLVSVPKCDRSPVIINESLNSNRAETGIVVLPKFPVSSASMLEDSASMSEDSASMSEDSASMSEGKKGNTRKLSTRNALYGINGKLNNVLYYPVDKYSPIVHNIIMPERSSKQGTNSLPEATRIVFTPLSDRTDLLSKSKSIDVSIYDISYNGVGVDHISDPEHIEKRFAESWLYSCKSETDIFFAPEMLATDKMVCVENNGSVFLKPLLKEAAIKNYTAPRLTIMPTYWKNGNNSLLIFDNTGELIGTQYKQVPFVNEKNHCAEALISPPNNDVILIHLINQQRIALVICAEFLARPRYVREFLCEKLGATLILVPSYSPGEQDFVDTLPVLKPYGTSVIWGNCCGAPEKKDELSKRIIGCGSFAGIDHMVRFGDIASCEFQCNECSVCLFSVDIPTKIYWTKPGSPPPPNIHHTYN